MLKAVTFDLWNTLITERPDGLGWTKAERLRRIEEILRGEQIAVNPEEINRAYAAMGERLQALWKTQRDIGVRAQVEWLLEILGVGENVLCSDPLMERLVEAYTFPILSELPIPLDGASEVLSNLDARGLRMAIICNTGRTPGKILRLILGHLNLAKYFSVQTFSDEVCLRKPHPEVFERTLAALGVQSSEALHVGDTLAADIAGALGVGMRAVHFCHERAANPDPADGQTIFSLPELLPLISLH
ncbi:MAG: HAD family hydrolase [Acidobacteria bacterium]|nr:HAD family hydrolase [Acidobacteriota bacterium]